MVNDLVSEAVERTVSRAIRQTVRVVRKICSAVDESGAYSREATVPQVAQKLGIDRSSARRRVKQALGLGYLKNLEKQWGRAYLLAVGDPLPEEQGVLPRAKQLLRKRKKAAR